MIPLGILNLNAAALFIAAEIESSEIYHFFWMKKSI